MRLNFRQGIVSYQAGGFLNLNPSGHIDIFADNKPVTLNIGHKGTNYIHSEDNPVPNAWTGPFNASQHYWLYWDFNLLTFERTFGYTTLEPVAQSVAPGSGNAIIVNATAGNPGIGSFEVQGNYALLPLKPIAVISSTGNDGNYTVASVSYSTITGNTTIIVNESVPTTGVDGEITLDFDFLGNPLLVDGRMWYDTVNHIHYVRQNNMWSQVLRVFAAHIPDGLTFISQSINAASGDFTGTQTGNMSSVLSGRILFGEQIGDPIRRDDGTFYTTEDQFFSNQSRVDGVRIESNVSRAQSIEPNIAAFTTISYIGTGQIHFAQYDDVGNTVVGMLTEDISLGEVGSVVLQGVITNTNWNWISGGLPVGSPLWVNNGDLIGTDPHVTDVLTYPISRVPVARVLGEETIIFEQGLGGKGDVGPPGSLENLPPATTSALGGVTLVSPSSDPLRAFVPSDLDPRLSDARVPLPHTHTATDITVVPASGILSNNVQSALEELSSGKLNLSGGILTGPLTLNSNPTNTLHAATKQYVDDLVSGLIWLEPVCAINMISDTVNIPPVTPFHSDAYIIPPGASGAWSAIPAGHVVVWDKETSMWLDRGAVTSISAAARFSIASTSPTIPSGSFVGQKNNIAQYDATGNLDFIEVPVINNAVYVCADSSLFQFTQWAYDGTKWVQFNGGQGSTADDITTISSTNILSVKQFNDGGINDVSHWQGLTPADLNMDILTDADTTTIVPVNGDALVFDGTNWVPENKFIDKLLDVDTTTIVPISGNALVFDGTNWVPGTIAPSGSPYTFVPLTAPPLVLVDDNTEMQINETKSISVLDNDIGIVGGELLTIVTPPLLGTASVNMDGVSINYTSGAISGMDTFTYDINNSGNPATVSVRIINLSS